MKSILVTSLVSVAVGAAPSPTLSGLYSVGQLGLVEFTTSDGKIVGKVKSPTQCGFVKDTAVVSGTFEGNVLVARVTLCQSGPSCAAQRAYPMLALSHGGAIAGTVRLDTGCHSPALEGRQLVIRPLSAEQRQRAATEGLTSARLNPAEAMAQADEAMQEGQQLIQDQKFGPAREKFRQVIELDPNRWEALMGYGLTEVKLNNPTSALDFFDQALVAAQAHKAGPSSFAQVHYNRACAQVALGDKHGAIASLKTAMRIGGPTDLLDGLTDDPDLNPIRTEPEFKRLMSEALLQHNRKKSR